LQRISLEGMTIEEALKKAIDAGPYPKERVKAPTVRKARPSRTARKLRLLPEVPIDAPLDVLQKRVEPIAVGYAARVRPERELLHVLIQIARVYVVVGADQTTLEHGPKAFDALRVNFAAHVFALVTDHIVRQ
jgi:hypothetical protein